ncbi:hypothetical protein LGQ03_07205 [Loktanella sp. TSTF-M6]|uniref:Transcriptional regulator n=1 Tax=Loktanella gaetbuli TaxID=2881335 RepID=A0ABS8BTH0_9RHOB|nr:hypothetical protein [Loktanella gaetbuli]MCB5199023.1 hypothetical protein [Loktanella gaetbuli]
MSKDTVRMKALMTLASIKKKRSEEFDAAPQQARDLEQAGRAERVKVADAATGKAVRQDSRK